ncbi:hypothetical protein BASA81_001421 [Batrachochytrium salamandrivorans]|nr:hypothetical protein BASA81_001421 [Batrachochytrium salamandrivorans]
MREAVIHSVNVHRRRQIRSLLYILAAFLVLCVTIHLFSRKLQQQQQLYEQDHNPDNVLENEDKLSEMQFADDIAFDDDIKGHKSFPRIFCMVPSQPHARTKFVKILDTWGKWCDRIEFMIDPEVYAEAGKEHLLPEEKVEIVTSSDGRYSANIVLLNKLVRKKGNVCFTGGTEFNKKTGQEEPVYTNCRHIWEKVWRSWVYVSEHYGDKYDFYFKVDDDTFFFVPTMREVLLEKEFKPNEHHYFGQRVFPIGPERGLIAGALVGFSQLTLNTIVNDAYRKMDHEYGNRKNFKHGRCVDRDGATEEVTTSLCAAQIGVKPEALYDETVLPRRPHMLLWMPRDMLTYARRDNSSSWFYKHAPRDVGTQLDCCSDRPVGFHFMRLDADLQRVYDLIVDPDSKNELEDIQANKVPKWQTSTAKHTSCVFDHMPFPPHTCILEANYWLRVKRGWHNRDPSRHYQARLE